MDQLNPAGFNIFNVPYKENNRFFPARETQNMAEADLSPTTFTSSSVSDSDYDISLRKPLKMKTKMYTLKLPVIIITGGGGDTEQKFWWGSAAGPPET